MSGLLFDKGIGACFEADTTPPQADDNDGPRLLGVSFVKRIPLFIVRVAGKLPGIEGEGNLSEKICVRWKGNKK